MRTRKEKITNHFNDEYVELSRGLGLMEANCEREAEVKDYFVLGYLIKKCLKSDEYKANGYVENDSCTSLWVTWGLERPVANESIYWLTINGYVEQIWLDNSRLAYRLPQWILDKAKWNLDKVDARKTKKSIDWADELIAGLKEHGDKYDMVVESIQRQRNSLKEKYDMLISRLKNVDCGVCEEAEI